MSEEIAKAQDKLFASATMEIPVNAKLSDQQYQDTFNSFAAEQSLSDEEVKNIEESTRGQNENQLWYHHRVGRLTASKFGAVNGRRRTTAPDNLLKVVMQYDAVWNPEKRQRKIPALVHGQVTEEKARAAYSEYKEQAGCPVTVKTCGLFIDSKNPWCGASPDGVVHDPQSNDPDGLAEFKSPFVEKFCTVEELIQTRKQFCLKNEGDKIIMNKKHIYYSQVQGQMAMSKRKWTDFVVFVDCNNQTDIVVIRVFFDEEFWNSLKSKLYSFYWQFVVAEIFSKRVFSGLPLYPEVYKYEGKNTDILREC